MLHLRVQGQGEVIRVLLLPLELGRTNLPSFLQVPREREEEAFLVKPRVAGTDDPKFHGMEEGHLDPRAPFPRGTRIKARVGMAHAWIPILADEGGRGYRSQPSLFTYKTNPSCLMRHR